MKICKMCKIEKPINEFHMLEKRKYGPYPNCYCKECSHIKSKEYREKYKQEHGIAHTTEWKQNHREAARQHDKNRNKRIKLAVVSAYGGICTCCGEHRIEFLTIEHINHDGKEHREKIGGAGHRGGFKIYLDILKQGCPNNYTIFCMNCNFATRLGKPCPHQVENQEKILPFIVKNKSGEKS